MPRTAVAGDQVDVERAFVAPPESGTGTAGFSAMMRQIHPAAASRVRRGDRYAVQRLVDGDDGEAGVVQGLGDANMSSRLRVMPWLKITTGQPSGGLTALPPSASA